MSIINVLNFKIWLPFNGIFKYERKHLCTSWLLKEAKFGRSPLLETDVHHSEERYLELLDSLNGVTEIYHLTSLTVSPGVT